MEPIDTEEAIVVIRLNGQFRWFKSNRELWVLDRNKWEDEYINAGFELPEPDLSERFGIRILDQSTAERFLKEMKRFEISREDLTNGLIRRFPSSQSWWDVSDLFPIMLVDFDRKHVCAFYFEGIPMERYMPNGWTSDFEDFATKYPDEYFPRREKFWIVNNVDMLELLNQRGREADH
jgi:hypothetical protein